MRLGRFFPKLKVFCSFLGVYVYLFVTNFNTNVLTSKVLFRIKKFCSNCMSIVYLISIHMCQVIRFCSVFRSAISVPNFDSNVTFVPICKFCSIFYKCMCASLYRINSWTDCMHTIIYPKHVLICRKFCLKGNTRTVESAQ